MTELQNTAGGAGEETGPTVSVVIPAYNAEETISRALDSVAAQNYENIIETIVVDDGSTDSTGELVREQYPHVRLLQQENQGAAVARNYGVSEATGRYIAFLDDDDEWLPEKVALHVAIHADQPGLVLSLSDSRKNDEPARTNGEGPIRLRHLRFRDVIDLSEIGFNYGCTAWFMDRQAFLDIGGFRAEYIRGQDSELLWRVTAAGCGVAFVDRQLFVSYPSWERRSSDNWRKTMLTWNELMENAIDEHLNGDDRRFRWLSEAETDQIIGASFSRRALYLCSIGEQKKARELLRRSFSYTRPGLRDLALYAGSILPASAQIFLIDLAKSARRRFNQG
jgi:glycosyltransferase involved in cell wall biosynthesis